MLPIIETIKAHNLPNLSTWISEAEFGYRYISEEAKGLECNSSVLEIGCGSGLLLAALQSAFKNLNFQGIEPFADGFEGLAPLTECVEQHGIQIDKVSYEEYYTTKQFDLIFCINVFEHVTDWRHMLNWAYSHLNDGGRFVLLCPNYSFPYESHFRLPIIINKSLTFRIFRKNIETFESVNRTHRLWESLNFVKKRHIKRYLKHNRRLINFLLEDDVSIIDDIVTRVASDAEFRNRQKFLGSIAIYLKRIGLFRLAKAFPNFLPYMKLTLVKTASQKLP